MKIVFAAPKGSIPEGVKDGETFDLVCTFRVENNGNRVCLTQMGDTEMEGYDKGGRDNYSDEAKAMIAAGNNSASDSQE